MNLGGALAGPSLVLPGYSGLSLGAAVPVAVVLVWTLTRLAGVQPRAAAAA